MNQVMGLDISQTSTGIACINDAGELWTETRGIKGGKADTLQRRSQRLDETTNAVMEFFTADRACPVLVEDLMMTAFVGNKLDRSAQWWFIVNKLHRRGYEVATASPGTLKKWATGKGVGEKNMIGLHMGRLFPEYPFGNDDEIDAASAAHLLAVRAGFPVPVRAHHIAANWKSIRFPVTIAS